MEILKFDESGGSSPSRKRSGRGAILVAFVAVALGAGTALASGTLTVNTNDRIQLAQAVATTAQCDSDVTTGLETTLDGADFKLSKIKVSTINAVACANKYLKIKVYPATGADVAFCDDTIDSGCIAGGKAYVKQITASSLEFTITNPFLKIADATSVGRVTVEITDTNPAS